MAQIELTQGKVAIIDDSDFDRVNKLKWHATKTDYGGYVAMTHLGKRKVYMHRYILGETNPKLIVDHKDRDTLNNRRKNLRTCQPFESSGNTGSRKNSTSKYKGVTKGKKDKRWYSKIMFRGKMYRLGSFLTEESAALAYNEKAKQLLGQFAYQNNI